MESTTRRRLSTGHEVKLPLGLSFAVGGVVVPARRRALRRALPKSLSPLPIGPGIGCVALVGIQYHRVGGGDADALEPYDEFGAIVPAIADCGGELSTDDRSTITGPLTQFFGGEFGGYVHWLPVTTDASVALGVEVWGYPKERADVAVTDGPDGIRTVVRRDDEHVCTLDVPRARGRDKALSLLSYATMDGQLLRIPIEILGGLAVRPGVGASVSLNAAADSGPLAELGVRPWPLARVYGSRMRSRIGDGEPVSSVDDD